jgi:hypothetical protein
MSKKNLKKKIHLVTSGCSFSDNCVNDTDVVPGRWPHFVAKRINAKLYNRGQGSGGNDWISKSVIYETQKLLDNGINPQNILVMVMWSGIDRKGKFISRQETNNFKQLLNTEGGQANPVNFIDSPTNENCLVANTSGYLVGSLLCSFKNNNINTLKKELFKNITNEELAIESYEHFLRVQWFCKSNNIKLINLTFMDIMHYPEYSTGPLTGDFYKNVKHLYDMIDFSNWIFWNQTGGIYEYTKDMKLAFYPDGSHPTSESHSHYVDCFLIPKLKTLGIV